MNLLIIMKFDLKFVFLFLLSMLFSFSALGEEKVLDLGAIEIQGEIRRPNVKLVYSKKKYFNKALSTIAKDELRTFEQELLKPATGSAGGTRAID